MFDAFVVYEVAIGREELRRWVCPDQWRMGLGIRWANDKKGGQVDVGSPHRSHRTLTFFVPSLLFYQWPTISTLTALPSITLGIVTVGRMKISLPSVVVPSLLSGRLGKPPSRFLVRLGPSLGRILAQVYMGGHRLGSTWWSSRTLRRGRFWIRPSSLNTSRTICTPQT